MEPLPKKLSVKLAKNSRKNIWSVKVGCTILKVKRRNAFIYIYLGAVVVAQLVEQPLLIPMVCGSAKFILNICFLSTVLKRQKRGREWPIFKKIIYLHVGGDVN